MSFPPSFAETRPREFGSGARAPANAPIAQPANGTGFGYFVLLVYLALVLVRPFEYARFEAAFQGIPLLLGLMGLLTLLWLAAPRKNLDAPHYPLMVGLLASVPLSMLIGARWVTGAIEQFNSFLPTFLLFVLCAPFIDSPRRLRSTFMLIVACACILGWHGIDQFQNEIGWSGVELIQGRIRYVGILADPNDLAMFFVMSIPLALSFATRGRNAFAWLLAACIASLMLVAIYLTNSRGGIMALASVLCLYAVLRWGRAALFIGPPLLFILMIAAPDRAGQISADESSASERIEAWYEGMQMLMSHPLFGVGKAQFVDHHIRTAHNSYVLAAAELGLVGYFLWLSLLVLSAMMLLRLVRGPAPEVVRTATDPAMQDAWEEHRRLARTLLYSFCGCLTAMFFLSRTYVLLLYLLLAMIVGLYQSARRQWPELPAFALRTQGRMLLQLTLGSVFVLWLVTRILLKFN